MRVGFLKCHLYCPCQTVGHFSHTQCIQSMLPSIPGNPLSSALASRSDMSFALGVLRYVDQETFTTVRVNSLNFSCIVLSPMWKYYPTHRHPHRMLACGVQLLPFALCWIGTRQLHLSSSQNISCSTLPRGICLWTFPCTFETYHIQVETKVSTSSFGKHPNCNLFQNIVSLNWSINKVILHQAMESLNFVVTYCLPTHDWATMLRRTVLFFIHLEDY